MNIINKYDKTIKTKTHLQVYCKYIMLLLAFFLVSLPSQGALTASDVAKKTAALINGTNGVSATFSITANGKTVKGSVKTSGKKFFVSVPQMSTWYNGSSLYTYNPRINETTVTIPTAQELMESNPLLYVNASSAYRYSFSPVKRNGKYVVDIIPSNQKQGIKKLTITVSSTTFHPEKISVTTGSGTTVITVTSFRTGVSGQASEFENPKSRYPNAEIIDLR